MRIAGVLGALLGIAVSVIAIHEMKPSSPLAYFAFAAWASAPFLMMLVVNQITQHKAGAVVSVWLCLMIQAYALMDAIVLHPDAQGGLVILFLPIYLVGLFLFSMFVAVAVAGRRKK